MTTHFLLWLLLPLMAWGQSLSVVRTAGVAGESFFTNPAPQVFEVRISTENVQSLRREPRETVRATVRVGGISYSNVGVHLKGVATFRPIDDQPGLTLNFSKFDKTQRFHGLRKIHLNNGKEDPTFLCERLSREMFAAAGLPVARAVHARVKLNGRDLGPYVVIEGFTDDLLERYFADTSGNLYDSGFRLDITDPLERLSGKKPDNWKDLRRLADAAQIRNLSERWTELARHLDTNNFSKYLAMQTLTANWDGYAFYKNNYRIYHDPVSQRLHFMPHGMDQTFARATFALMPPRWEGLVARAFVETPEGRTLYLRQLALLYTNTWNTSGLVKRVDEWSAPLRPMFADQGREASIAYDRQVAALRRRLEQRGQFLAQQFSTTNWTTALPTRNFSPPRRIVTEP